MNIYPATRIIRVKNCHLNPESRLYEMQDVRNWLNSKGFSETSNDGFFITFENPDYKEEAKNILITIGLSDDVAEIKYTTAKLD